MNVFPNIYRKARRGFGILPSQYAKYGIPDNLPPSETQYLARQGVVVAPSTPALAPFKIVAQQPWMSDPSVKLGSVIYWNGAPYQEVPAGSGNYVKTSFGMTQGAASAPAPSTVMALPSSSAWMTAGPASAAAPAVTAAASTTPAATTDTTTSWFEGSTTIAGYTIQNLYLAGAGALAVLLLLRRGRGK